jgi:hypothetical protein
MTKRVKLVSEGEIRRLCDVCQCDRDFVKGIYSHEGDLYRAVICKTCRTMTTLVEEVLVN